MNKDERLPFASHWELKEAMSSRWSCAGDSLSPPLAPALVWSVPSSSLTSWPGCSMACRLPTYRPSLASPFYSQLSRLPPVISRRCGPCVSIQSPYSTPNNLAGLLENRRRKLLPPQTRLGRLTPSLRIELCRINTWKRRCRLSSSRLTPHYRCAHRRPDWSSYVGKCLRMSSLHLHDKAASRTNAPKTCCWLANSCLNDKGRYRQSCRSEAATAFFRQRRLRLRFRNDH